MSDELILFDKKFNTKQNKVLYYLHNNTKTKLQADGEKFIYCFTELYRLPILKPLLDAILTECKNGNANFVLFPLQNWDRVAGHCRTTIENSAMGGKESQFTKNGVLKHYEIVIKKFTVDLIIHEIAHAIEHIADINLNGDFRNVLAMDMQAKNATNRQLLSGVNDVMHERLKNYPLPSIMAELFARFFEMLAMSKDVDGWGSYQFTYLEASKFFHNTITWVENFLIPILYKKNDTEISLASATIIKNLQPYKEQWTKKIHHKFKNAESEETKWRDVITSRNMDNDNFAKKVQETFDNVSEEKVKKLEDGTEYIEFKR